MNVVHTNGNASHEADPRQTFSPYASPSIPIHLQDNVVLYIPEYCLQKCDKLHRLYQSQRRLDLDSGVGHVVVHYLVTDTYQHARSQGKSDADGSEDSVVAEFKTGVGACVAAHTYGMAHLLDLARGEVERLGAKLPMPLVLRLLQDGYTLPAQEDAWLYDYVESRVRAFLKNPTEPLGPQSGYTENGNLQVIDLLVKSLYEIQRATFAPEPADADLDRHYVPAPEPADSDLDRHYAPASEPADADLNRHYVPAPEPADADLERHCALDTHEPDVGVDARGPKAEDVPALTSDNVSSAGTDAHSQPSDDQPAAAPLLQGYQDKWATLRGGKKKAEEPIEHVSLDGSTFSDIGRAPSGDGSEVVAARGENELSLLVDADQGVKLPKKDKKKKKKRLAEA